MLNFSKEVQIDDKKVRMAFYFKRKNECVHCGGKGTLVFIDKYDKPARGEIRSFSYIECKRCGKQYSILWNKDEESAKMYPSAVDYDIYDNFKTITDYNPTGNKEID